MSSQYYGTFWNNTVENLKVLISTEKLTQKLETEGDRLKAHGIFGSLYVRYVALANNLGDIYDQMLQCQKREIVFKLLVASLKRLGEMKKELDGIEMSEFMYIDNTLIQQK